jgi:flagellar protein FlgJ
MRIASTTAAAPQPGAAVRVVEARRTQASMSDIRASLSTALESLTGRRPSARTVDVLAAQVSLETAGGSQMFNFNFGGIKGVSPSNATANYMTREVLDGQSVHVQQGFRAYGSLDEGARDYVSVLRSRFPQAFHSAAAGDVDGFAQALKQSGYYTAPEQEYARGLRSVAGAAASPSPAVQQPATEFGTSAELSRVLDAVMSTAARIADPDPEKGS